MRKSVLIVLAAAVVALLAATGVLYQKVRLTTADVATLRAEGDKARASYSDAINSIAMIQDSLNAIVLGDSAVRLVPSGFETERALTSHQRDDVLEQIALLKAGIERTKARIQDLDTRLKHNGVRIAGLQRMIASLKRTVGEKEAQVAALTTRVDSLETAVTGLVAEVQQGQETISNQAQAIEDKRRELGTVFVAIGTKKELTTNGVVVAEGGLLGIGKTLKPSPNVNENLFQAIDTDAQTTVRIPAAKAQVISAQPLSSYQLAPAGEGLELRILDPREFRKVKHLVILTT